MNFARMKRSNPSVNWGQQSGSGIDSNGENPYQKGGFRSADQEGRGGTYSSGTDPYQRGGNYGGMLTVQRRRNVALSTYGKSISKTTKDQQRGGSWVAALPIALQLLESLQGGKGQQRGLNIFPKLSRL